MSRAKRVLSIQSHVVSGYVGNKAATFPLQLLGYETDCVNSVNFSNHTGYQSWKGTAMNGNELSDLIEGLTKNDLGAYDFLLTGYIGSESFLRQVVDTVKALKKINPDLLFVCDTVMGDDGVGLYVPKELVPIYKNEVIPVADILTPNAYEAGQLTGIDIHTKEDAVKALAELHSISGAKTVVITSAVLDEDRDHIYLFASNKADSQQFYVPIPLLKNSFTGSGDLFTCLLMAYFDKSGGKLDETILKVLGTLQVVLKRTIDYAKSATKEGDKFGAKNKELRLLQSKDVIEHPPKFDAECYKL